MFATTHTCQRNTASVLSMMQAAFPLRTQTVIGLRKRSSIKNSSTKAQFLLFKWCYIGLLRAQPSSWPALQGGTGMAMLFYYAHGGNGRTALGTFMLQSGVWYTRSCLTWKCEELPGRLRSCFQSRFSDLVLEIWADSVKSMCWHFLEFCRYESWLSCYSFIWIKLCFL